MIGNNAGGTGGTGSGDRLWAMADSPQHTSMTVSNFIKLVCISGEPYPNVPGDASPR
jgi:hypothetical protein